MQRWFINCNWWKCNGKAFTKTHFRGLQKPAMAIRVNVVDGGGPPKDSENTPNSFLTAIKEKVFWRIGADMVLTWKWMLQVNLEIIKILLMTLQPSIFNNISKDKKGPESYTPHSLTWTLWDTMCQITTICRLLAHLVLASLVLCQNGSFQVLPPWKVA